MKIAIFSEAYYPYVSGVVTHVATLRKGLEAAGHKVMIVTLNTKVKKHTFKDGVLYCPALPLKKLYDNGIANPYSLERFKYLKDFDPDIVHIQTEFTMGLFGMHVAKKLKKPMVYTLHTMYDKYIYYILPKKMERAAQPFAHAYIRKICRRANEIIGPSKKVADYVDLCGVDKPVSVVPNTVDVSTFLPKNVSQTDVDRIKTKLGIKPGDTSLCFVGRIGKEKSIELSVEYFTKAFGGDKKFNFFVIGEGPDKEELQQQINAAGVNDQIKLLGRIENIDLPPYYSAFDLFTTSSLTEMNSISLLESNASGLYAINRLDSKNTDQVISGVNGEVYTTIDEYKKHILAYAALSAEEKNELRRKVSEHSQKYGLPEFIQSVQKIYLQAEIKHNK